MINIISEDPAATNAPGDMVLAEIRGCGKSSDVEESEFISIESLAQEFVQLVGFLIQHWGYQRLNIVGHSTGASLALTVLINVADKLNRVVLVDPVGAEGRFFDAVTMNAFQKMKSDSKMVIDIMKQTIGNHQLGEKFFSEIVVPDAMRASKIMGFKIAQAFGNFNCVEKLGQIKSPVLVLHGDRDQVLPLSDSRKMANLITGARFEVLQGLGHCPNLEDPARLWSSIRPFLFG